MLHQSSPTNGTLSQWLDEEKQNNPEVESHSLVPQVQVLLFTNKPSADAHCSVVEHLFKDAVQNNPEVESHSFVPQVQLLPLVTEPSTLSHMTNFFIF
jgi:hypothetical protein